MRVAVDHLQVRQAPEVEQLRPAEIAMLPPHAEQRNAVIDFGSLPQPRAAGGTATLLQLPEQLGVVARCVPELPGDDAGGVPNGVIVGPLAPQVFVPAEPIDRLTADAARPGATRVPLVAIRCRRGAEPRRQRRLAVSAELPGPADGRTASHVLCPSQP